jgi:hypothetical protein
MITWNHDLVAVRQSAEPVVEIPDLNLALGEMREIPGMDQQFTCRDVDLAMQSVRIRHADDFQGSFQKAFDFKIWGRLPAPMLWNLSFYHSCHHPSSSLPVRSHHLAF